MIRYYGESNVPGAPGQSLMAGSPGYFMPEAEIQRRFQERHQSTPQGQKLQENINRVREQLRNGTFPWQQAQGTPGMSPIGNAGAFADNAQFYMGSQAGQMPVGFQNKFVS
jgi:hypothetical protein